MDEAVTTAPSNTPAQEDLTETIVVDTEQVVTSAVTSADAMNMEANLSAIASAKAGSLVASGSAVGLVNVDGDAEARFSAVGIMSAKGSGTFNQSYASAFVAGEDVSVFQGGAPLVVARTVRFEQAASVVSLASSTSVRRGFIGLLVSGQTDIGDDSKVLLTGRSVLIIALAVLGGFGLVALAMAYGAERVSQWRPSFSLPARRR